jgi:ATP-binding cassette subfamily B (MDR/TAP) protein 1
VFFSVLMGAMNMGQASPYVEAFSIARGSAAVIFGIMDRTSPIDSSSRDGIRPADLRGRLQLRQLQQHALSKIWLFLRQSLFS